jgi:hypothetical protein
MFITNAYLDLAIKTMEWTRDLQQSFQQIH